MHRFLLPFGMAVLLTLALRHAVQADRYRCASFQGRTPPELISEGTHWINSADAITLNELRGRPVWLQFNF